jgi:hypothetical protein
MASSGMLRRVALVRTDVSQERAASNIRVKRLGELVTLAVTSNGRTLRRKFTDSFHPDDGGAKFLRKVGSYKSQTVWHPRDAILHSHRRVNLKPYFSVINIFPPQGCGVAKSLRIFRNDGGMLETL